MPNSAPIESFYDDLDESRAEAWRLLIRAARDRRAPMHTPAVATVGLDGRPKLRTVVLRSVDPETRTLRFHTDRRSSKVAELAANPSIEVLAYDPVRKIQLRICGRAKLHHADNVAAAAWAQSQEQSRLCYRQAAAPGIEAQSPADALAPGADDGEANFVAVEVAIESIDWLYLAAAGHRRARFDVTAGSESAVWLAP